MDFTKEQLESIFAMIVGDLDGAGLIVTDEDLLRESMGLPPSED